MKRKIMNCLAILTLVLLPTLSLVGTASAACGSGGSSKDQVLSGIGETRADCDNGDQGVTNVLHAIVDILSIVVGVVAIIMIIVAGFKYITSGGDSGRVTNAKNTLIYALVGLAIAALAQTLVHFVLFQTDVATRNSSTTISSGSSGSGGSGSSGSEGVEAPGSETRVVLLPNGDKLYTTTHPDGSITDQIVPRDNSKKTNTNTFAKTNAAISGRAKSFCGKTSNVKPNNRTKCVSSYVNTVNSKCSSQKTTDAKFNACFKKQTKSVEKALKDKY